MVRVLLCFCLGVIVVHQLPALPPPWLFPVALCGSAPLLGQAGMRYPWACLAGAALAVHAAHSALEDRLPEERWRDVQTIEGRIADIPVITAYGARFTFRPMGHSAGDVPRKLLVRWFGAPPDLQAGSVWRLRLRLRPPTGRLNPGASDWERYYLLQRIGALANVVSDATNEQLVPGRGLHFVRQRLSELIRRHVHASDAEALAVALAVGDRQYISDALRDRLLATGTSHLVAISGLHVGLVAGGTWWLAGLFWRVAGLAGGRIPAAVAGVLPALVTASAYAALAGLALPTRRALLMAALAFTTLVARRGTSPWTMLCTALAAVLALDPLAPLGAGLWLSFGAVATLLFVAMGRSRTGFPAERFVMLQLVLLIALAPLTWWWFGQVAWLAAPANLFAIPLVGSLVVPVLLSGLGVAHISEPAGGFLLAWAGWMLNGFNQGLDVLVKAGPSVTEMAVPPAPIMLMALLGAALLMLPRGVPGRLQGCFLLFLPFLWQPPQPAVGTAQVIGMDVGHGHALLIRTRRHALLFDTGPKGFSEDLHHVLRHAGVERLDLLVISNERAGSGAGADKLATPVTRRVGFGHATACADLQAWSWDGVTFRFLDDEAARAGDCLLLVEADNERLLLGHALSPGGARALARAGLNGAVEWFVVPQHGHRKTASRELATQVAPRMAVIPVDRGNRYGLPHAETVATWEDTGATVLKTGDTGAITVHLGERRHGSERGRRYWQRPVP